MKKRVLAIVLTFILLVPMTYAEVGYSDIESHWAKEQILRWTEEGLVVGSGDKFRPNDTITRAEMAVIIDRIMKYKETSKNTFKDLPDKWYTSSILKNNRAGVMNGYEDNIRPEGKITREESIVMLSRALELDAISSCTPKVVENKTIYIKISFVLTNLGLAFLVVSLLMQFPSWTKDMSGLFILLGVASFVRYIFDAYKNRLRKKLDIGMKLTVLSFLLLAASFISGLLAFLAPDFLSSQIIPLSLAFGINLILGFFTSLILGQMYKTLPFILWLARYQDKVGKFKTPLPADLYSEKIANAHYYSFIVSIVLLNISLFIDCKLTFYGGVSALFMTGFLYTYNTMKIVLHKENLKPLK